MSNYANITINYTLLYMPILKGSVVVVIVWYLDLPLPMQSVPITTRVVSLNPVQARCTRYNIMW